MVFSKRGLLWAPPKWQAASSERVRTYTELPVCTAPAPPSQDVGVLIGSFLLVLTLSLPSCSSLARDVRTMDLKNQACYTAHLFSVMAGAERGKKGNAFLATAVEM